MGPMKGYKPELQVQVLLLLSSEDLVHFAT